MLIRLIVKLLGGVFILNEKYRVTKLLFLKKIYAFLYNYYLRCDGSWISMGATFHGLPCFPHGIMGIFISGGAIIGKNCVIFQQVTIGSNTLIDSKRFGAPIIGDNCYIGSGAKIIGKVRVGNNVRIGANAVVYEDIPDNYVVASGAQKVMKKNILLNNNFYHMYKGEWLFFKDGQWQRVEDSFELSMLKSSHFEK